MAVEILHGPLCADRGCVHESCYRLSWQAPWMVMMYRARTPEWHADIELRDCDRECGRLATWEAWTRLTYSAWCDQDKPPEQDGLELRHQPEGVLRTDSWIMHKEA